MSAVCSDCPMSGIVGSGMTGCWLGSRIRVTGSEPIGSKGDNRVYWIGVYRIGNNGSTGSGIIGFVRLQCNWSKDASFTFHYVVVLETSNNAAFSEVPLELPATLTIFNRFNGLRPGSSILFTAANVLPEVCREPAACPVSESSSLGAQY